MKVSDLIKELQAMDPDAQVHFRYPSGDYWRTTLAPAVTVVDEGRVAYSQYHNKDALIDEDDGAFENADEVVILR